MTTRIAITPSADMLADLIANDPTFEIELRNGVMSNLTDFMLPKVMRSQEVTATLSRLEQQLMGVVTATVQQQIGNIKRTNYGGQTIELNDEVKKLILAYVDKLRQETIQQARSEFANEVLPSLIEDIKQYLTEWLQKEITRISKNFIQQQVDEHLKMVREALAAGGR